MMSLLTGVITRQFAIQEGLPDANKFLLLGWALGSSPVGFATTLLLANNEADQLPPAVPAQTPAQLAISIGSLPVGEQNVPYQGSMTATGGVKPYQWSFDGKLPGVTLDPNLGTFGGTPTAAGTLAITVRVTDAKGTTASLPVKITLSAGVAITTNNLPNAVSGTAYPTQNLTVTGGTPPFTWSNPLGSLPPGLTLDPNAGTITGTPTASGTYAFTVQASDSIGGSATQIFTLAVG